MRRGSWFVVLALLALTTWLLWPGELGAPRGATNEVPEPAPAGANASAASSDETAPGVERRVALPPSGTVDPGGATLRVRLRGMHREVPWTAPLHLALDGPLANGDRVSHDAAIAPDAQGLALFPLPTWAPQTTRARLGGVDPNYRAVMLRTDSPFDPAEEVVLDVQVVARVHGRVLDGQRTPLAAARVEAFAMRDGMPVAGPVGQTNTRQDGTFTIAVPPGHPLMLVAMPTGPSGKRMSRADGAVMDGGRVRSDLLPGSCPVHGVVGTAVDVGDLVLAAATPITGFVRWADGAPIAGAAVLMTSVDAVVALPIDAALAVEAIAGGGLRPSGSVTTSADGTFAIAALPGPQFHVDLAKLPNIELVGEPPRQVAVAGASLTFTLPRPVRLQVTAQGKPVPLARLEIESAPSSKAGPDGQRDVVLLRTVRVRAEHEDARSPWFEVPVTAAGTTVELQLARDLTPVAIEFDGEFRVRNAMFQWRSQDGRIGSEHRLRDDQPGAFQLFLEPGRYHLTAGPGGGERNGRFLLPVERDFDVGSVPVELRLPAVFGGTFNLDVTDRSGLRVGGHCRVTAADGSDRTPTLVCPGHDVGLPGDFFTAGTYEAISVLLPGTYALEVQCGDRGVHRQQLVVREREVAEVRVRLP